MIRSTNRPLYLDYNETYQWRVRSATRSNPNIDAGFTGDYNNYGIKFTLAAGQWLDKTTNATGLPEYAFDNTWINLAIVRKKFGDV